MLASNAAWTSKKGDFEIVDTDTDRGHGCNTLAGETISRVSVRADQAEGNKR